MTAAPDLQAPQDPFVEWTNFVQNAFVNRFQGILLESLRDRRWRVVASRPGDGKSSAIADLIAHSNKHARAVAQKTGSGLTSMPLLNAQAPNNRKTERALGTSLAAGFGIIPHMPWDELRPWLLTQLVVAQTKLIIADDAHSLSLEHLQYLKELTDTLAAPPYNRRVGLVFVAVSDGVTVPLEEYLMRTGEFWEQFRRRFAIGGQFCFVQGLSLQEVVDVCATYEEKYRSRFPDLALVPWAKAIQRWLTRPELDPSATGRVTMHNLREFITLILRTAQVSGQTDINNTLVDATGLTMTVNRTKQTAVDGDPPESVRDILRREIDGEWAQGETEGEEDEEE